MLKRILMGVTLVLLTCSTNPVEILSVYILPDGGNAVNELTATFSANGSGNVMVKWLKNYGEVKTVFTEIIPIPEDGVYSTTYPGDTLQGYFWVDIYDETGELLLIHSDSVFCGTGASEAPVVFNFYAHSTSGEAPHYAKFWIEIANHLEALPYFTEIDFGDNTPWAGYYWNIYETPGIYTVTLTVSNFWGEDVVKLENYITVY